MKKTILLLVTTIAAVSMTAAVMGQGRPNPDEAAVGFRQALMTLINGEAGPLLLMQRGRMPYNPDVVAKNAANLTTLTGMIPDAFARNTSSASGVKTEALPVVWRNHDEFLMNAQQLKMQADALETAVKGGNEDDIKNAVKNLGGVCGQCHMKFRQMN